MKDKVVPNNIQLKFKKTEVEDQHRISSISNKTKSVTACNDSLNSRTLNVNIVCATCGKYMFNSNHDACVSKFLNDMNARTKKPNTVQLILFIVDSGCIKYMTGNLKLLCNFVEKYMETVRFGNDRFTLILGYGDLVQGNITINRVYYVEGLNHNLFLVGQFCDVDLEVAFWKSTCFVRDLQGNDLLTDYINLLLKKDIVIGLPKLKYVKDQLCSSCEVSKAKRSSFKTKVVPSSEGRLNLLHMNLCGHMRVASINGKKYILVIVDDYSRYTWTLFPRSNDETPEVLKDFLKMIQQTL
ncbi:retrovirus-related pol polyprotein from transposon TNT 1-94 [Tanacetum coccineum]